jgi:hypothetical protein
MNFYFITPPSGVDELVNNSCYEYPGKLSKVQIETV